jgi:trehalose 6-phosphate synthase
MTDGSERDTTGGAAPSGSAGRRLIVAANRGPVSFHADASGEPVVTRGLGGLVSVLGALFSQRRGTWIAAAQGDEEARLAEAGHAVEVNLDGVPYRVRYVVADAETYRRYYTIVANPMLWFVQHYLWDLAWHPDIRVGEMEAWRAGYLPMNERFADAIVDEVAGDGSDALVMLHDYHLYTVAPAVRARSRAFITQFVHIPWPQSDYWRVLPREIRTAVFGGLLANDIVAFHTAHYVRNFLQGCSDVMDARVDYEACTVEVGDRLVWVRAYPVSIDPGTLRRAAGAALVLAEEKELFAQRREHLLVRVDRLDPSKNIVRGFNAFDRFLELHPEFKEKVTFLALLQPSREDVEEYVLYRERVMRAVEHINTRHGTTSWMPIDVRIQDNFPATLAAYRTYDALLVNAIFDGMNLVAKEGAIVNEHGGVLILSENTGAYEEIGAYALSVNPFDIEEQADAIFRALTMPADERARRLQGIREVVEHNSVERWIGTQLDDIDAKLGGA